MKKNLLFVGTMILLIFVTLLTACPPPPEETYLPGTVTITPAGPVSIGQELTANYDGGVNVSYQWRLNGSPINSATETTYTPDSAGTYTVIISATGYISKISNAVNVTESKTLVSIEVTTPPSKLRYELGEDFNPAGMIVKSVFNDGSKEPITGYNISGFSSDEAGVVVITVTYDGKETTLDVTILEAAEDIYTLEALTTYLNSFGSNTADDPIRVKVIMDDIILSNLVNVINNANRFVDLNLSESTSSRNGVLDNVFNNNFLVSINLPSDITSIANHAFLEHSSLTSVIIPDSVTTIGHQAFGHCSSLTSVTIGNGVTTIADYAFQSCSSLTSITIPDSVTTIGQSAFSGCSSLASVIIGNSVTSIGSGAFYNCSSLISVIIGNSVSSIGDSAFSGTSLTSVIIPDSVTSIGSGAFYNCSSLISVIIGNNVTSIGGSAFRDCSSLANVTIGNSVTTIGVRAFENCISLTSVTIPDSVTNIGSQAFSLCSSLTSVIIPDSVTSIGISAFSPCSSLASVTIGNSVTTIERNAFFACYNLTSVRFDRAGINIEYSAIQPVFFGDLHSKYIFGGIGTYTRDIGGEVWTKVD